MREPGTARIAVDLLGGDQAPAVVVDGALRACQADPALQLLLVGPVEAADAVLAALGPADRGRVCAVAAPTGPHAQDRDVSSVESGVRSAVLAVAQGLADAVVSAGNTGATVTSAALGLGRWPGVRRPALTAVLPTAAGRIVLLDVGSSVDPDETTLAMHARLGAAYASVVHGVAAPRVGLLTIGTERGKGDRLRRAVPAVLAALDLPAGGSYAGLVEGNDVVTGAPADVVVADGFTGNVLLKGLETAYALLGAPNPGEVPPRAAVLLGVGGTVVVCHGAASGADIAAGIGFAAALHRRAAVPAIADLIIGPEAPATDRKTPDPQSARGGS
ncbi:phosphate acyltransferase PlsX [Couchioplanes caeruleus]|uniref:Phosphate acyltransferase n=2 Tax=Couchioplanes caeruleus TaxID=56438 RepID=A0A1K0G916_9ACTN|nr:phosphate acyltransferase PlsX [Couchioplanes caeruleus]OJF13738.1 fatty acid synthesis plsX protein [Couchioplanes caeruleus subsp. caeruleus]ROP32470.1 glycerol-3-phosphate acyltransferase PlsX [Couchioplanes caeruleus]